MTDAIPGDVQAFFTEFERAGADHDTGSLAALFAPEFLNCDPAGAGMVPREAMLAALPRRERLFHSAGLGPARLRRLSCEELDESYVLARTSWAVADSDSPEAVTLESSFLLRRTDTRLEVVVYLNHHDLATLLSTHAEASR